MIMYGLQFYFAMQPDTTASTINMYDAGKILGLPFDLTFTKGDLIACSTVLLSVHYNFMQFYKGYCASKDKLHALICMVPYF